MKSLLGILLLALGVLTNVAADDVFAAGYNSKPDQHNNTGNATAATDRNLVRESYGLTLQHVVRKPLPSSDQPGVIENEQDLLELVKSGFGLYMAQDCHPTQYPGWESFPVEECRYSVKDRSTGLVKSARVLMLNPTPEQAAGWIRSACQQTSSQNKCHKKVVTQIKYQSGFQFPVAGVVYEDILPCTHDGCGDGVNEAFCFRNGVTVRVRGFTHLDTKPLSEQSINTCLQGDVTAVLTYARIHGGTREEYRAAGGMEDVGTSAKGKRKAKWMEVVRDAYQAAWESPSYFLLDAWVKVHLSRM